jgi:hypothetical protein
MKSFITLLALTAICIQSLNAQYSYTATKGVSNPANPFDELGAMHNQSVVATGNAINWNLKTSKTEMENKLAGYLQSTQGIDATPIFDRRTELDSFGMAADPAFVLKSKGFSKKAIAYFTRIESTPKTLRDITTAIKTIENEIIADTSLPKNEKDALLSMAAVSRYSNDLWSKMMRESNSPLFQSSLNEANKSSRAGEIAFADARGALFGAIIGSVIFGAALPGALAGAARASIFSAATVTAS